jgi:hypothetical protein
MRTSRIRLGERQGEARGRSKHVADKHASDWSISLGVWVLITVLGMCVELVAFLLFCSRDGMGDGA